MHKDQVFPTAAIIGGLLIILAPGLIRWVLGLYLIIWGILSLTKR